MYIGVSTLLLGKSETTNHPGNDDTTETPDDFQDDFFENDADSLDDSRLPLTTKGPAVHPVAPW